MTPQEADKIIDRIKGAFSTYNKLEDINTVTEYKRALVKFDYTNMNAAVDCLIYNDDRKDAGSLPSIPLLIKKCREQKHERVSVQNEQYCEVCDDKGFVMMEELYKVSERMSIPYQFVLYCPFCEIGRSQAYCGKDQKEHKTEYNCEPLTKYFDNTAIEHLRKVNRAKKNYRMTAAEREEIQRALSKVGARLPAMVGVTADKEPEHGDAWEGDESECPF